MLIRYFHDTLLEQLLVHVRRPDLIQSDFMSGELFVDDQSVLIIGLLVEILHVFVVQNLQLVSRKFLFGNHLVFFVESAQANFVSSLQLGHFGLEVASFVLIRGNLHRGDFFAIFVFGDQFHSQLASHLRFLQELLKELVVVDDWLQSHCFSV